MNRRQRLTFLALFLALATTPPLPGQEPDPFAEINKATQKPTATTVAANDDPFDPSNRAAPTNTVVPPKPTTTETAKAPAASRPADAVAATPTGRQPKAAELIDFEIYLSPGKVRRGQTVRVTVRGTPKQGYHTYPMTFRAPEQLEAQLSSLRLKVPEGVQILWPITETGDFEFHKKNSGIEIEYSKSFTWSQDLLVLPAAAPGRKTITIAVGAQVCDEQHCTPGNFTYSAELEVTDAPAMEPTVDAQRLKQKASEPLVLPPPGSDQVPGGSDLPPGVIPDSSQPKNVSAGSPKPGESASAAAPAKPADAGLIAFMLQGIFWGAVSLVTPCVFPMIPITVSFFLKQSEKENHRPVLMAAVYCATIVIVLTIAAVTLLSFFRWLSVHPMMNFVLGGLFIYFSLSLFGMYEIELPQSLAQFTSAREGQGGFGGTIFMALTFTIISFACVAPFLGGFGGTADTSQLTFGHRVMGGMAFSATFASPFFILALFPTLLQKVPKSGNWLNEIKVVMGFVEIAAALKFLRTGELLTYGHADVFTYNVVVAFYVGLATLCALYLLNVYRLPHDSPIEHLTVPRMIVALLFLTLGLYLMPALFKDAATGKNQRPAGKVFAWLDSFFLPDPSSEGWFRTLEQGMDDATKKKRLVFVDFTGVSCTNCNYNEQNVFPIPTVQKLLEQYSKVRLYTDIVPDEMYTADEKAQGLNAKDKRQAEARDGNLIFQRDKFDTEQLPLYVILEPKPDGTFREVSRYDEGKINNDAAFVEFLRKPLK